MSGTRNETRNETRHTAVSEYFAEHRKEWRDRYASPSFDARNYRRRAEIALGFLRDVAHNSGTGRLLEIGCGAGVQANAAHQLGFSVYATDLTVPLLRQAHDEFPGPSWLAATAENPPFPDGAFDVVMMLGVIGYVNDPSVVLSRVHRLLKPGGHLVISWARSGTLLERASRVISAIPDRLYMAAKRALVQRSGGTAASEENFYASYNRFWPRAEFLTLLRGAGFAPRQARGVNFGQFRFMDRALWPERMDNALSATLEHASSIPGLQRLGHYTRTHVALARRA